MELCSPVFTPVVPSVCIARDVAVNLKAPTFSFLFFVGVGWFQIAVWNSYKGMNLTETNRDKNNNVTDSLANRTLIVTTILVRKEVKQRTVWGEEEEGGVIRGRAALVLEGCVP